MIINLESKLINIISDKEFIQLSDSEKRYVLARITEEEYSFYKKMFTEEKRIEEIIPNISIKQNLDAVLNKKRKAKIQLFKPLIAVASVIIIAISIWSIPNNRIKNKFVFGNESSNMGLSNTEITNVLLNLGRIENQSSRIIPSLNSELKNSIDINSKVCFTPPR